MLSSIFKTIFCVILASGTQLTVMSQKKVAAFKIRFDNSPAGVQVPVAMNIDDITFLSDSTLSLIEVRDGKRMPVPFQLQQGATRQLYWEITSTSKKDHRYELIKQKPELFDDLHLVTTDGQARIEMGQKKMLNYYFNTLYPPPGVDTNFRRSGFIHPLWTPNGQELTRIQAPDHYHHYGIWNPWTHVVFEGDTVDFWNIKGHQGTVRFAKFVSLTSGPVFSEFEALHEHVVFKKDGTEKVALNELQTVRVFKPEKGSNHFIVDITSKMNCATQSPFQIVAYRYGGIGWRTTGFWNNDNCEVLTSEGKNRDSTDGSKARWCIVQGALPGDDSGGIAFLSHPGNYNHPEPMRIWVKNTNQRGDMFFNFAPTKDRNWLLEPGNTYVLKYRLIVFNGKFNAEKAEAAWKYFAAPPKVVMTK